MKQTLTFTIALFASLCTAHAQKHDHHWLMGIRYTLSPGDPNFGTSHLDFNTLPVEVYREEIPLQFNVCNTSISDSGGNLLFYSNCSELFNADGQPMLGSGDFNQYPYYDGYPNGLQLIQGIIGFQSPSDTGHYHLVHQKYDFDEINGEAHAFGVGLYHTEVDMAGDGGLGEVVEKGVPIVEDTLAYGTITATRHANGRDWWIIVPEYNSNRYHRVLLGPEGPVLQGVQEVGVPTISGLGQAAFSPDGNKYVRNSLIGGVNNLDYLDIYDFDRCTGLLSDHVRFPYGSGVLSGGGAALSPDGRMVYVAHRNHVFQYDLWADDVETSRDTVAVYDGYLDGGYNPTTFFLAQLAPDGRIYLNSSSGTHWLHAINSPDRKGAACGFEQRRLYLPTVNVFSIPNFPNFRLGPLDGSPCDTLGLDNFPVAKFRYDQDTTDYLTVGFTDLSYYEPGEWHWDFGDNTTSQDTSPVHTFFSDGAYEVCLTVTNSNGSDTHCGTLQFGTVPAEEAMGKASVSVFPNPAREGVNISLSGDYLPKNAKVTFFDSLGKLKLIKRIFNGRNTIWLNGLSPGVYYYQVRDEEFLLGSGKLMVKK